MWLTPVLVSLILNVYFLYSVFHSHITNVDALQSEVSSPDLHWRKHTVMLKITLLWRR